MMMQQQQMMMMQMQDPKQVRLPATTIYSAAHSQIKSQPSKHHTFMNRPSVWTVTRACCCRVLSPVLSA